MSLRTTLFRITAGLGLGLFFSEGCDQTQGDCVLGSQGCGCADDGACVGDLECLSSICVPPGSAADQGSTDDGSETAASESGEDDSAMGPDLPDTAVCDRLLQCLSDADPSGLPEAIAAYGPDGSCWVDDALTEVCLSACASTLGQLSQNSAQASCRECEASADCRFSGNDPFCLAGACVQCLNDSDCPPSRPRCSIGWGTPVCLPESDCDGGGFGCADSGCIPEQYVCDGYVDCPLGEDEMVCG